MGLIKLATGQQWNILERVGSAGVVVTSEDTDYPKAALYDGRAKKEFRFSAVAANDRVTVDTNLITDPGMETWASATDLTYWTETITGGSAVNREAVDVDTGTYAVQLVRAGGGIARIQQTVSNIKSGWGYRLRVRIYGILFASSAFIYVRNTATGKYLNTSSAWQSGATHCIEDPGIGAPYETHTRNFVVESFDLCQADIVSLSVWAEVNTVGAVAYVDNFTLCPAVEHASVHGHNLTPACVLNLRKSTDNFVGSDVLDGAMTIIQPAFYRQTSALEYGYRWWRFDASGHTSIIRYGELCLTQPTWAPTHQVQPNPEFKFLEDDVMNESEGREMFVTTRGEHPRRTFAAKLSSWNGTEYKSSRDDVYRRSRGRRYPLLAIPDVSRDEVLLCRIDPSWKARLLVGDLYDDSELVFSEVPFAVWVA